MTGKVDEKVNEKVDKVSAQINFRTQYVKKQSVTQKGGQLKGNEPTFSNFMAILSRYMSKKNLYETNEMVTDIEPFTPVETLTKAQLESELRMLSPRAYICLLDTMYTVPSQAYIDRFLKVNTVDTIPWSEEQDCDNISLYLVASEKLINPQSAFGMCVGITLSGQCHAWGIYRSDKGIRYVEPQDDRSLSLEDYDAAVFII